MEENTEKPAADKPADPNATPPAGPPPEQVPPRLNLEQAVAAQNQTGVGAKKQTTRIDMAAAAMIPEEKSKTTRINLGSLGMEAPSGPKTIKIQRPSEAATIKINRPGAPTGPAATPPAPPISSAQAKRQTSRIPLQTAMGNLAPEGTPPVTPAEAVSVGPKTIRIKRPDEPISGPATAPETPPAGVPAAAPAMEAGPPTQRKTIKLRRPGMGTEPSETTGKPSGIVLPKSAAAFAADQAAGQQDDEPGPAFGILSLVATLAILVLLYVLCAQALPQLGLPWPGQTPTL